MADSDAWRDTTFSVINDPRVDPEDEHDQLLLFEINKLRSKLDLRDKLFMANKKEMGTKIREQKQDMENIDNRMRSLLLDLNEANNIPFGEAYQSFPHRRAPKTKSEVARCLIPGECDVVYEQANVVRRYIDECRARRKQLRQQIAELKGKLHLEDVYKGNDLSREERFEQRVRGLVNSYCKMQNKIGTASSIYYTYKDVYCSIEKEVLKAPSRLKALENEYSQAERETNDFMTTLKQVNAECAVIEKQVQAFIHGMRKSRSKEEHTIHMLMLKIDPGDHPHLFAADDPRMIAHQRAVAEMKQGGAMEMVDSGRSAMLLNRQAMLMEIIKQIAQYKHVADKVEQITKIPFARTKDIGNWFKRAQKRAVKMEQFFEYKSKQKKRRRKLRSDLNHQFEVQCYGATNFTEKLIKHAAKSEEKCSERCAEKRRRCTSMLRLLQHVEIACGKWLKKFAPICNLALTPAISEDWIKTEKIQRKSTTSNIVEMFLVSLHTIQTVAQGNITRLLQNSGVDLKPGLNTLTMEDRAKFAAAAKEAKAGGDWDMSSEEPEPEVKEEEESGEKGSQEEPEKEEEKAFEIKQEVDEEEEEEDKYYYDDDTEESTSWLEVKNSTACQRWFKGLDDEQKQNAIHGMFQVACEANFIHMNKNNARIGGIMFPKREEVVDEQFEPDERDFVSRSKIKKNAAIFQMKKDNPRGR